jgi:hypothetical protein
MNSDRKLLWGTRLVVLGYLVAVANAVESLIRRNDPSLHHRMDSGVALVSIALTAVEMLVILRPLRRPEPWAFWAVLLPLIVIGIPRLFTDPACQIYDLSHHGCHQFMIGMFVASIGLLLSCNSVFRRLKASSTVA